MSLFAHRFEDVLTALVECQTGETVQRFYLMASPIDNSSIIKLLVTLISASTAVMPEGSRIGVFVAFFWSRSCIAYGSRRNPDLDVNTAVMGHNNDKGMEFTMLLCTCASNMATKAHGNINDHVRSVCCIACCVC